jgi:hypothetical protein
VLVGENPPLREDPLRRDDGGKQERRLFGENLLRLEPVPVPILAWQVDVDRAEGTQGVSNFQDSIVVLVRHSVLLAFFPDAGTQFVNLLKLGFWSSSPTRM